MKSCDIEANPVGGGAPFLFVTGICYVMLCVLYFDLTGNSSIHENIV